MRAVLVVVALAGCGDNIRGSISIAAPDAWHAALGELVALTPYRGLALGSDGDFRITVVDDPAIPAEGFRIDADGVDRWLVSARDVLGAQYGVTAALENLGFRFRHPFDAYTPFAPEDRGDPLGVVHRPEVRVRGLQLHTLHPIEGYFAFWEPSPGSTDDAHRILDWLIKNRGNYVQWVALDDIMAPDLHARWHPFTRELIDYAHMRGVRVGLNIQLFGSSNLQLAFDLHDREEVPVAESVAARLPLITDGLPFDVYDLSFGEFFGAEPQKFIDSTNEVARQLKAAAPQAEMHALVHVGADQRVDFMGRNLIYYFLVQFADPAIVPDIHTVMFYNLFDDAGGAYHHDDFSEHRGYLLDRMCAGKPAAYQPETGYWVAFDISIPMYLPVYVYSRWRDLDGLAKAGCGPLDNHMLFTTGWEWGYWLHDVAALRASYALPDSPSALIADAYAPDLGPAAAGIVARLVEEQKRALIDQRLAGYLASTDVSIEAGRKLDPPILSQPDPIELHELVAATAADRAAFAADVLEPLAAHAGALDAFDRELGGLSLPESRWTRELRDGMAVTRRRVHYVIALYRAVLAHLDGADPSAHVAHADRLLAEAAAIVTRRHADLHDTHRRRLVDRTQNNTFYQYGYLHQADVLCFWSRERLQAGAILGNTTTAPPGCIF